MPSSSGRAPERVWSIHHLGIDMVRELNQIARGLVRKKVQCPAGSTSSRMPAGAATPASAVGTTRGISTTWRHQVVRTALRSQACNDDQVGESCSVNFSWALIPRP